MSPILLRPVREQLEHDRVVRLLFARSRRRFQAGMNPGAEQNVPVGSGERAIYPDLVLASPEGRHRLEGVVEVETGESVNSLEALAEWAPLARLHAAFHLYVPAGAVDAARRLCNDHGIVVNEIWSYHPIGDQMRFTLVHRAPVVKKKRPAEPVTRKSVRRSAGRQEKRKPKPKPKSKPKTRGVPKQARAAKKRARATRGGADRRSTRTRSRG